MERTEHARRPGGTPAGGQFATRGRPEGRPIDQPRAAVHGEVSSYAASQAQDARYAARDAADQADAFSSEAAALEARAAAALEQSGSKGPLGRWSGRRKAKKATRQAHEAARSAEALRAEAEHAESEAGRLQSGVNAEQQVVRALTGAAGVRHVLCGLDLGPGMGDVDAIAVGSHAVVVEVKAGRGELRARGDGTVTHGGRQSPGQPLTQCLKQSEALRDRAGVNCTGVVCFPDAEPSAVFHRPTGCWLVGGTDQLSEVVTRTMEEYSDQSENARAIVTEVQRRLGERHDEVMGWVEKAADQDAAAMARIAKWQGDIARSAGWSKGPEIRANLSRMIAENQATMAQRAQKVAGWTDLAFRLRDAIEANERMLGS